VDFGLSIFIQFPTVHPLLGIYFSSVGNLKYAADWIIRWGLGFFSSSGALLSQNIITHSAKDYQSD
jgi:hypothetical protein